MPKILVTGGAGYIGSQTVLALLDYGFEVVVFDSLEKSHAVVLPLEVELVQGNLLSLADLRSIFTKHVFSAVIHFAAYIEVGESQKDPSKYYQNNVAGTLNLLQVMSEAGLKKIVFSSTAAVYGFPKSVPIDELEPKQPINVYGRSKAINEDIITDFCQAYDFSAIFLRYFNACGADPLGRTGENHNPETHLIPSILYTLLGKRYKFTIFGTDYDTPDGTCIRDYVHTTDLATAHVLAGQKLLDGTIKPGQAEAINLGTSQGYSIMQIVEEIEKITSRKVPLEYGERRSGDPDKLVAGNQKAKRFLGWQPQSDLTNIIQTAWQWHSRHQDRSKKTDDLIKIS